MAEITLVALYVIFGGLAVAALIAGVWIGAHLAWDAFDSNFLSPGRQIVEAMQRKQSRE